jgi:hypothetical protein
MEEVYDLRSDDGREKVESATCKHESRTRYTRYTNYINGEVTRTRRHDEWFCDACHLLIEGESRWAGDKITEKAPLETDK